MVRQCQYHSKNSLSYDTDDRMAEEGRLKFGPYLTVYNKDYVKRVIPKVKKYSIKQEFKDPICEGFKNYLELDQKTEIELPSELANDFLEEVKKEKNEIITRYFEKPLDCIAIKGDQLLKGKSVYQIDYCDIEADIKMKLLENSKKKCELAEDHVIPLTTHTYDFRPPLDLSTHAMEPPLIIKHPENLGQNEKVNKILNVKTGDSEYNNVIGKLGDFIVNEQMHGKIVHPECGCVQHKLS